MSVFKLDDASFEEALSEISGGIRSAVYKGVSFGVLRPTMSDRDSARNFSVCRRKELASMGIPTRKDILAEVSPLGMFGEEWRIRRSRLESRLEAIRAARKMSNSQLQIAGIDVEISSILSSIGVMEDEEEDFFSTSLESQTNMCKEGYLLCKCSRTGFEMEERVWGSYNLYRQERDLGKVSVLRTCFRALERGLPVRVMMAVARNPEWRKRWKACKQTGSKVFGGDVSDWSGDQVDLCHWSDWYDSVTSNQGWPGDDIIDDDDKVFEWIRETNRTLKAGSPPPKQGTNVLAPKQPYSIRPRV